MNFTAVTTQRGRLRHAGREAENRADADRQGEENASEEIETPDSRTMKGGALWHILRKNRSENIIGMN